ncbi:hypothetical protein MSAN_00181100 [Mycena sanguinolenta]|uniref:Uncharacterized protein n=1 Tax=Mycena sanguinolenta TaxID=230812 RepID=A0A8H6ZHR6_9AGAR|nr:hypothetical protein MSAN_00181100 [Mycena sanguinolenta]
MYVIVVPTPSIQISCGKSSGMHCFQPFPRPSRRVRKSSTHTRPPIEKTSHSHSPKLEKDSTQLMSEAPDSAPVSNAETTRATYNALKLVLKQLSTISSKIPIGEILSGVIDPFLDIADRIEQMSDNAKGLDQLALRIERLTPTVTKMAESASEPAIGEKLRKDLGSMTTELAAARSKGRLKQFINSVDNAACLDRHNTALNRMIADCTLEIVQELKMQEPHPRSFLLDPCINLPNVFGNITGGTGGAGGNGRVGGDGGEGEGPQLDIDPNARWKIGDISGGTGGAAGSGVEVGGKGGTGKGPVIRSGVKGSGKAYRGPRLSMGEFCRKYHVSEEIRKLLEEERFETVRALSVVSDTDLREAGLKGEQIAELKRALKDLVTARTRNGDPVLTINRG